MYGGAYSSCINFFFSYLARDFQGIKEGPTEGAKNDNIFSPAHHQTISKK